MGAVWPTAQDRGNGSVERSVAVADGSLTECTARPIAQAILQNLLYADLFNYPLTADEIHRYLPGIPVSPDTLHTILADGFARQALVQADGFYALPGRSEIIPLRQRREALAERLWARARRYARLIAHLPFVRLVAVTGTLAVGNVEAEDDIDFFIITVPGRLWLCRALVIGVVRLARLLGDELCPNYFLSERMLELTDRNLFTARELAQMVPLYGSAAYHRLRAANAWTSHFLPNADAPPPGTGVSDLYGIPAHVKRLMERALAGRLGDWLERWERRRKIARLSRQAAAIDGTAASFTADCCKGHFEAYDRLILERFQTRLKALGIDPVSPPHTETSEVPDTSEVSPLPEDVR